MANFTAGTSFSDGVTNDVTAAKLNALVADAVPTSNLSLNSTTGTIATFNSTTGTIPTLTSTTLITTGTGTAATPAIVPTGDANTGIFFPAADTIAFSEGGAEAIRIDSNGNVGIGTNTPDIFANSFERNIGILTPSTTAAINISGGVASRIQLGVGSTRHGVIYQDATNFMQVGTAGALPLSFTTNGTERLRIDSSGNVGIGTTSPAAKLDINGKVSIQDYLFLGTDRSGAKINIDANPNSGIVGIDVKSLQSPSNNSFITFTNLSGNLAGSITHNGTTTVLYNTSSDYRLKEITGPVVTSGAFIDALKPKFGSWKEDGSKFVGFLAHEFAEVSTSSVSGEKDATNSEGKPIYQSMQASSPEVMANIVAELQSIRQRLTALEAA